jgi:hypothetical protein
MHNTCNSRRYIYACWGVLSATTAVMLQVEGGAALAMGSIVKMRLRQQRQLWADLSLARSGASALMHDLMPVQ